MSRVLVATAVPPERDAVARAFTGPVRETPLPVGTLYRLPDSGLDLLAAGVGPAGAAASVAGALTAAALADEPYTLVVSAGIGGGFAPHAPVGSLVLADEITVADLGAESGLGDEAGDAGFLPVTALGFGTVTHLPPPELVRGLARVTGALTGAVLTVSTATGTAGRAALLRRRHPRALAEAMEGFGVAEAAAAHGVPVTELRAVSNPVGPRDRTSWRIGDALAALTAGFAAAGPKLREIADRTSADRTSSAPRSS